MREIKFRAKRMGTEEWVTGDISRVQKMCSQAEFKETGKRYRNVTRIANYEIQEETVGQFTGLRDCNAKEIYEGDILKYTDEGGRDHIRCVVFDAGSFCFSTPDSHTYTSMSVHLYWRYAIIGNIHDNPELFTAEK